MEKLKVGILGACGWMGRVHTSAYANLERQFGDIGRGVEITWLVDSDLAACERSAASLADCRTGSQWRAVVDDPAVNLVDICLPDKLHHEVAKAALLAGKNVYCEKPLTDTGAQARELADIAAQKGLVTRVGHSFPVNPVHRLARKIIDDGEIGDITFFRGTQHVDSHGDPAAPFIWRLDGDLAATGIVGDTGTHVFSFMDYLIGDVVDVSAHCPIIFAERPVIEGATYGMPTASDGTHETRAVTNPDLGMLMCRFASGAIGAVDFSRVATGRRFVQRYEIYGTKGSILYDYDQITRLQLFLQSDPPGKRGYRSIDVGPEWEDYASFLPLPNFGLGYNEIKMLEVKEVVQSVISGEPRWPTFRDGAKIMALVDACMKSSQTGRWEPV